MSDGVRSLLVGAVYVLGSGLVFVLGSTYYALFPTNRSWLFRWGSLEHSPSRPG